MANPSTTRVVQISEHPEYFNGTTLRKTDRNDNVKCPEDGDAETGHCCPSSIHFQDMKNNPATFKENFHMSPDQFDSLLNLLRRMLDPKPRARISDYVSAEEKLCVTLEFLASGSLQRHIASIYRISKQRLGPIIEETCGHIYDVLKDKYMPGLSTNKLLTTANKFHSRWNFPNCLGAIDGKHIPIKCPQNAGSLFYNYKGFHSIVLMAVADADYKFLYTDIGAYGSEGDSSIFRSCWFGKSLLEKTLPIPRPMTVYGREIPHVFLADDAFPLMPNIMKPFKPKSQTTLSKEQRIFNYRLSRARRCVENAFGIMCARWICLARTLFVNPVKAQKIVAACCVLHNMLIKENSDCYCPSGFADSYSEDGALIGGRWRNLVPDDSIFYSDIGSQNLGRPKQGSLDIRNHFKDYFSSTQGKLDWQDEAIFE